MWTSDGSTLVFPAQSHLMAMPAAGGVAQPIPNGQWVNIDDLWALPPGAILSWWRAIRGVAVTDLHCFAPGWRDSRDYSRLVALQLGARCRRREDSAGSAGRGFKWYSSTRAGRESEPRAVSPESQNRDGAPGLAWTQDGKIVYDSEPDRRERSGRWEETDQTQAAGTPGGACGVFRPGGFEAGRFHCCFALVQRRCGKHLAYGFQWPQRAPIDKRKAGLSTVDNAGRPMDCVRKRAGRQVDTHEGSKQRGRPIQLTDYEADSPSVSRTACGLLARLFRLMTTPQLWPSFQSPAARQ